MSEDREDLIRDLVADLRPVRNPGRIGASLLAWLALAGVYSVFAVFAAGPLREGAIGNLWRYPMFGIETVLATAAIVALAYAALLSGIPGNGSRLVRYGVPIGVTALWVGVYVVGFWHPAHPVSTLGAREHCVWQTLLFSIPTFALMLWLTRRLMPLAPRATGALAGAAAAAIPGALMQFGCMYVPGHILVFHLSPTLIMAIVGFLVAPFVIVARQLVPRGRGVPMH